VVSLNLQSADTICSQAGTITLFGSPAGGTYSGSGVKGNYFYPDSAQLKNNLITYSYTNSYGCTSTITDSIYVKNCLGIEQLSVVSGKWSVFPNPGTGKFTVQLSVVSGQWSVEVYNVLGQAVYSHYQIIKLSNHQIDLSSNPDGVYMVGVITDNGMSVQKVVKIN
jgi:hypothetical protein